MRKELDWFSKVDVFRQDGFYCDYEEQLKNPINIKHDDYISILKRLEKVRQVGIAVIDGYNSEDKDTVEQLAILRKEFKQNDHYRKIGDSLVKMRRTKQNPFDIIKQSLDKGEFLT